MPRTDLEVSGDLVLGVTPFGQPNARLVAAVCRAGGLGVLDLGTGDRRAREALRLTRHWSPSAFGVRVPAGCALRPADLCEVDVSTILLGPEAPWSVADIADRYRVLVEVTSVDEAVRAQRAGAHGVVARGSEAGGRVGSLSSFVLLQQLMADSDLDLPVWVCGGIGLHTAPAVVAGGAAGVVLDTQLSLLSESDLPEGTAATVRTVDGSETAVIEGWRGLRRGRIRGETARTRTEPLPIGQDAFLARQFSERFESATKCVRAVRAAIIDAHRTDGAAGSLVAGTAMCRALGTALPIVQGPMTRVSDRAEFAAAVATEGAMPMLALALANQPETRALLEHAQRLLGSRPWGVGILGFAPEEVRAAQLEVIRELRPSCAVIAGGRPAQAAALEEAGVSTFLHVPSPGLLGQFLDAGARKFVFEGSECGGHIGPRSSLSLWEAQLGVLLEQVEADPDLAGDLHVLFAGGIHDERSAAMVAAMAAPLAQAGTAVGVLLGTAYLFTDEAVHAGAIQRSFQQQVARARQTELLETAPGHAIRCVRSPFTAHFHHVKEELRARGVPDRQRWEELEQLNVGRLRLASKGTRRQEAELVTVDEATQLAEGLFMAGDVAVLRSATTTIAALHEAVTSGADRFLTERTRQLRDMLGLRPDTEASTLPEAAPLDIAVVGMACTFPLSSDLDSYWSTVVHGIDAVTEVPAQRWDTGVYYSPDAAGEHAGERTPSKWGGFLPRIPFDPLRYGIPPASMRSIEPVQLLALEVSRRALADAGYGDGTNTNHSRTSVVFGADGGSDLSNATVLRTMLPGYLGEIPAELAQQLPTLTEDSFPGMLANVIAGRVANRLDLGGANYTVDAACASSLAAVDVACKELVAGSSDLVLCGAADLHNSIHDYLLFSSVRALSPTGRCRTFDAAADGIVLGEGVACVALKRLADAERDGDRVYAVIKGVGSASDGRSLGLTAPRLEGQRHALERAYRNARVSPRDVGLVEAHGTGTVMGDRTELAALTSVFTDAGAEPGSCVLGSVKSQIGHTKCAAGLAGLIKVAMALHTGIKPPTLHVKQPNEGWQSSTSPFGFLAESRPWSAPAQQRIAGVSAFGFGGTNFHVVLKGHAQAEVPRHGWRGWPAELFTFRGADFDDAGRSLAALLELAQTREPCTSPWRLRDLACWASRRSDSRNEPVQIALVAEDLDDLTALLRRAMDGEHDPAAGLYSARRSTPGKLAVLFPGQGSQRPGMLAELFTAFPELQRFLGAHHPWVNVMFPPAAFNNETAREQEIRLRDTRMAQPALGITGLAVNELLCLLGVVPDMLAGHSYGELVALCAAGAMDTTTLLELSSARAEAILSAAGGDPGAMAAVAAAAEDVERVLRVAGLADHVLVANHNAPRQVVISGPTTMIDRAVRELREAGQFAKRIEVACAFHSPVIAGAQSTFGDVLSRCDVRAPELPVWSNRTAEPYPCDADGVHVELAAQLVEPVRFTQQIESMYAAGARVFVEAGPGQVLSGLVGKTLGDRPHTTIALDAPQKRGLHGFLNALAELAVAGVPLRTGLLFTGRNDGDVSNMTVTRSPQQPAYTIDGHAARDADGDFLPGGLAPARRISREETRLTSEPLETRSSRVDQQLLVSEFLRSSREMIAAQRDVLLSFLGAEPRAGQSLVETIHGAPPPAVHPSQAHAGTEQNAPAKPPAPRSEPEAADSSTDVHGVVVAVIADRTGYPADLIEPDLDLETDLSIDSIKRAEIAGELATRCTRGSTALADDDIEQLAKLRTVQGIVDWLSPRVATSVAPDTDPADEPEPAEVQPPLRFTMHWSAADDSPRRAQTDLAGTSWLIVGGSGPVVEHLSTSLNSYGATVMTREEIPTTAPDIHVDGVFCLTALSNIDEQESILPNAFPFFRSILVNGVRWMMVAAQSDNSGVSPASAGLRGFVRAVAHEYPDTAVRLLEIDTTDAPTATAAALIDEVLVEDTAPVVSTASGARHALRMVNSPLGVLASTGGGPADDGTAEVSAMGLDRESVVLLVGGARGITARVAAALARACRCRIELVGRTELPDEPEDPVLAQAADLSALRRAFARLEPGPPAEIDRRAGRVLAQREVLATIDELRNLGSAVRYHTADVRDQNALEHVLKDVYAEHGRLDGVAYAAGVIEDRLVADKDQDSFHRVFSTKVDGARNLFAHLQGSKRPAFVVLFGSIAAALGNPGQADYAAANDALDALGSDWAKRTGSRALTVHWGPWAPRGRHGGMVTEEIARSYARRGLSLLDPEEASLSLLRELAWGSADSVIYAPAGWSPA